MVDRTQWAAPFNIDDFKRQEIDRQVKSADECAQVHIVFAGEVGGASQSSEQQCCQPHREQ